MAWQPIETAPKDRVVLLYRPTAFAWALVATGMWCAQETHKRPRPYWKLWPIAGNQWDARAWEPTHWMPLPEPPEE